jgi:hypothetical protein
MKILATPVRIIILFLDRGDGDGVACFLNGSPRDFMLETSLPPKNKRKQGLATR